MADTVLDATVVAFANGDIAARSPGNVFDRRLAVIEQVVAGVRRLRYNAKLAGEYKRLVRQYRNDVIELLFIVLDSRRSVRVPRNTLSRQDHATAVGRCGWPSHDQHLLAAALGGVSPVVVVTEARHATCATQVRRAFGISIHHVV